MAPSRLARRVVFGLLLLALPGLALAHRVNVFAYVEGGTVHVEAYFQRSAPARNSAVAVGNASTGTVYLRGRTDDAGRFAFPVPAQARTERADLEILVEAGEGHQNRWTVKAAEYMPAPGSPGSAAAPPAPTSTAPVSKAKPQAAPAQAPENEACACPPPPDPTPMVEAAVERKIAPLRQMLLDSREPGLKEIASGIGYLLGIAGLIAYARSRRPPGGKP
jgi:nickel transport protein